jgi:hypothetical protein
MTKINLTPTAYVQFDGRQYTPYYFEAGNGEVVRDVRSGEMVEKKDKWVHTGTYHTKISHALRALAMCEMVKKDEYTSLQEAASVFENAYKELSVAWEDQ